MNLHIFVKLFIICQICINCITKLINKLINNICFLNHKIISYGEDAQPPLDRHRLNWLLTIGKENKRPRKPILEVSSIYGIAKATEVGMGIASLPDWMEFEMIELTEILSQLEGPKMSISLCFNYELRNDSRIKAFKDFMIKEAEIIN